MVTHTYTLGNALACVEQNNAEWSEVEKAENRAQSAGTSDDLLCKHLHNKKEKLPITATRKPAAAAPFRMARTLYDICKCRVLLCSLTMAAS